MMQIKPESVVAWGMVVSPFMTALLGVITLTIGNRAKKASDKAEQAASAAAEAARLSAIVADKTHMLVNSQYGAALAKTAIALRQLANITNNPDHIKAADEADRQLHEHLVKQQMVDNKAMREGAYIPK